MKITYNDVKKHLTEDQQDEYFLSEDFKKEMDRRIRNSNHTLGTISPTVLNHRSGVLQKYYAIINSLTFEQLLLFKGLLALIGDPDLKYNHAGIAREFSDFERLQLLIVIRDYHGLVEDCYVPFEKTLQDFANSCTSPLYADLL